MGLTVDGSSSGTLNNVNFLNTNAGATTTATRIGLGITNSAGAAYTYIEANEGGVDSYPHLNFYTGSSATKRLEIADNGDLSLYEDTGTTAKFFWDASTERLGIGNTAPTSALDVTGTVTADGLISANVSGITLIQAVGVDSNGFADVEIKSTGTSGASRLYFSDTAAQSGSIKYSHSDNSMQFATAATERMRINAVGVLQSNGYSVVASSARPASGTLRLGNIESTSMLLDYDDQSQTIATVRNQYGTTDATAELSLDSGFITFNTGTSFTERMRILADGSVAQGNTVARTASQYSNQGGASWYHPDQHFEISTTSNVPALEVGKNNANDGSLIAFRKQGDVVGIIGTQGGDLNIGTAACGIAFVDGVPAIYPWTTTGNTTSDAAIDLGDSGARFKDLYLSGGVYLGGTGAANHLDDYEEGTWTPTLISIGYTFAYTTQAGIYTKIGNMVSVKLYLRLSGAPTGSGVNVLRIGSLPFTSVGGNASYSAGSILVENSDNLFAGVPAIRSNPSVTYLSIYDAIAGSSPASTFDCSKLDGDDEFQVSIVYHTA
jgi:hypothetical protein